jgi:DNA-binding XRE family transcriptional regulator
LSQKNSKVFVLSVLSPNICALKKENELRKLWGISQNEMAMLLQIS